MKTEFISSKYTAGQLNAIIKKITEQLGENAPDLLLQDKMKIRIASSTESKVVEWLGTTNTPATRKKFIAKEKFVTTSDEVKFCSIWNNFFLWFIAGGGKTEEPLGKQEIRYGNLKKGSIDDEIIRELGGKKMAEVTLYEVYGLLKKQEKGEEGILLTSGLANIFYVKDDEGTLCAVVAHWRENGWGVDAHSIENPGLWPSGRRVFSRNS